MIPYGHQEVDETDVAAVVGVLKGDWLSTGPAIEEFEERLREWTGGVPTVAVSSGTAALHTAYAAAGIGPGDAIITPPITFVATQATAIALGASVVFADVYGDTANISPAAVRAAVTPFTKAIVAVDYAGHPADMDELRQIADEKGLLLIEDAAHSIGSIYRGRHVGELADITTFSFYPTKNITTAEGGALAIKDPQILERARRFARQGVVRNPDSLISRQEGAWHQEVHEFGLNYRLSDILAALGTSQLVRLRAFKERRVAIKAAYDSRLSGYDECMVPAQRSYVDPTWHLYPLQVPSGRRRDIFEALRADGIGAQVNYMPAYWHPAFAELGYRRGLCPVSETFYSREISLPIHMGVEEETIEHVSQVLAAALTK